MAIPSEGIQAAYRNHMNDVDAFFRKYHGDHFMIWNLSEFTYDAKFSDKVRTIYNIHRVYTPVSTH